MFTFVSFSVYKNSILSRFCKGNVAFVYQKSFYDLILLGETRKTSKPNTVKPPLRRRSS